VCTFFAEFGELLFGPICTELRLLGEGALLFEMNVLRAAWLVRFREALAESTPAIEVTGFDRLVQQLCIGGVGLAQAIRDLVSPLALHALTLRSHHALELGHCCLLRILCRGCRRRQDLIEPELELQVLGLC